MILYRFISFIVLFLLYLLLTYLLTCRSMVWTKESENILLFLTKEAAIFIVHFQDRHLPSLVPVLIQNTSLTISSIIDIISLLLASEKQIKHMTPFTREPNGTVQNGTALKLVP